MKKNLNVSKWPSVGDGVTIYGWTDRTPGTIIQVSQSGKRIVIQEYNAIRTDNNGVSESLEYTYERDEKGPIRIASLRKNGAYCLVGGTMIVSVGERRKYYDYSF